MAIVFSCVECNQELQTVNEHAGRKVHCRHCRAVNTVPRAPVAPSLDLNEESSPRRASAPPPPLPLPSREAPRPSEVLDQMERRDRKRDRSRRGRETQDNRDKADNRWTLGGIVLAMGGGLLGLILCVGIGFAILSTTSAPPPVAKNRPRPMPLQEPEPPQDPQPAEFPKPPEEPNPAPRPPVENKISVVFLTPMNLILTDGKSNVEIDFENRVPEPNQSICRPYRIKLKPGSLYWIGTEEKGISHNDCPSLTIEGAEGKITPLNPSDSTIPATEQVFEARAPGLYTITVKRTARHVAAPRLVVRELTATEQLPLNLRLPVAKVDLPTLVLQKQMKIGLRTAAAAFSPDSKSLLISELDGTMSQWDEGVLKGATAKSSLLKREGIRIHLGLTIDFKGRVYAQECTSRNIASLSLGAAGLKRSPGDIQIWDSLTISREKPQIPAPTRTLPLKGIIVRMISSPDGKFVYFLDKHNGKVGRIDAETGKIDREVKGLPVNMVTMCLTADGKRLYCCSADSRIEVIDTVAFRLLGRVKHDQGVPLDIAATNSGLLYMIAMSKPTATIPVGVSTERVCVVDLRNGLPAQTKAILVSSEMGPQSLSILPDQRSVLLKSRSRLLLLSIPARPNIETTQEKVFTPNAHFPSAGIVLSPDGRTAFVNGVGLYSIGR